MLHTEVAIGTPTYQDVLDAPENMVAEILAGVLHLSPRPTAAHTLAAGKLYSTVDFAFSRAKGGPGGWLVLPEPELHLGFDIIAPDIAGWRLTTMNHFPAQTAYFETRPDWVCEVLSPSTEKFDRTVKLHIYARERVSHVWLVNPFTRTLEVLRLDPLGGGEGGSSGGKWMILDTFHDDQPVRAEPFDAVELELAELWANVRP